MGIKLDKEIVKMIDNPDSIKILATVDKNGEPHVVVKESIKVNEDGFIEYLDYIESSQTNKNMVHSIWFGKRVAINIFSGDKSFQIKGIPYRALIHGHEFEERYRIAKEQKGVDLSTVWWIEPVEIKNQTLNTRIRIEKEEHPILGHLDWITKE